MASSEYTKIVGGSFGKKLGGVSNVPENQPFFLLHINTKKFSHIFASSDKNCDTSFGGNMILLRRSRMVNKQRKKLILSQIAEINCLLIKR